MITRKNLSTGVEDGVDQLFQLMRVHQKSAIDRITRMNMNGACPLSDRIDDLATDRARVQRDIGIYPRRKPTRKGTLNNERTIECRNLRFFLDRELETLGTHIALLFLQE